MLDFGLSGTQQDIARRLLLDGRCVSWRQHREPWNDHGSGLALLVTCWVALLSSAGDESEALDHPPAYSDEAVRALRGFVTHVQPQPPTELHWFAFLDAVSNWLRAPTILGGSARVDGSTPNVRREVSPAAEATLRRFDRILRRGPVAAEKRVEVRQREEALRHRTQVEPEVLRRSGLGADYHEDPPLPMWRLPDVPEEVPVSWHTLLSVVRAIEVGLGDRRSAPRLATSVMRATLAEVFSPPRTEAATKTSPVERRAAFQREARVEWILIHAGLADAPKDPWPARDALRNRFRGRRHRQRHG